MRKLELFTGLAALCILFVAILELVSDDQFASYQSETQVYQSYITTEAMYLSKDTMPHCFNTSFTLVTSNCSGENCCGDVTNHFFIPSRNWCRGFYFYGENITVGDIALEIARLSDVKLPPYVDNLRTLKYPLYVLAVILSILAAYYAYKGGRQKKKSNTEAISQSTS